MGTLPNVIIPGAPKSGTTSLGYYLNESEKTFFLTGKELKFFHNEKTFRKGIEWYESHFNPYSERNVVGEISNIYLYSTKAVQRIASINPSVKFIFCLRNPIYRAFSQYNYAREKGTEIRSFRKALELEHFRTNLPFRFFKNNYAYASRGNYYTHLQKFFTYFNQSQFYFCIMEELYGNPVNELKKICDFLQIPNDFVDSLDFSKRNVTKYPKVPVLQLPITLYRKFMPQGLQFQIVQNVFKYVESKNYTNTKDKLSPKIKSQLQTYFRSENEKLASLIHKDLSIWNP